MTVGVIYRVAEGAVLVSDGRITHDGEIASESARKCFMCGLSTAVIVAGDIGPLWRRLQERPPKTFRAFRDAVDADTDDTDWLAYDRRSGRMWLSDVRITIPFAAVGSGATLATGALEALPCCEDDRGRRGCGREGRARCLPPSRPCAAGASARSSCGARFRARRVARRHWVGRCNGNGNPHRGGCGLPRRS
jgi:hypothetical protein